ncbi:MAG: Tad domain-containing protein [Pseudomonadota bacterium]
MSKPEQFEGGFLTELLEDSKANTIAIGAAAMVPLLAMVGGAVDASRYYMTETRLQAACDAGALAARRAMETTEFTADHRQIGENFFDQNFESGMFGIENGTRAYTATSGGEVVGTASGNLPTSLMGIFGYGGFPVSVDCNADINISNTDIMFVVDVTGSMNCAADNPNGGNCNNTEIPTSKIVGLRTAVMDFYDTVESATSPQAQVRYGMVPYASNVNVGNDIVARNANWMASDAVFQSRWAKWDQDEEWNFIREEILEINRTGDEWTDVGRNRTVVDSDSKKECKALKPDDLDIYVYDTLGKHQGIQNETINGNQRIREYRDDNERVRYGTGFANFKEDRDECAYGHRLWEDKADVTFQTIEERDPPFFVDWIYTEVDTANPPGLDNPSTAPAGWNTVNIRNAYGSSRQVQVPMSETSGNEGGMINATWDGCIEEANTATGTTWDPIPAAALDMNINLIPSTEAERWKPVIQAVGWQRKDNTGLTDYDDDTSRSWRGTRVLTDVEGKTRLNSEGSVVPMAQAGYSCPAQAFRMAELENNTTASTDGVMRTRQDLQNYVDSLRGRSNTYHDIGMLWGARYISPRGIFASDNATAPNGDAIGRHIVFMTDGILAPNSEVYGTYGVEWWGRRVSGDANYNTLASAHAERFQAACRLARQENISVWVVAFGTALSQNLIDCASPGRAFVADDSTQLSDRFKEIAQRIAALRLTN